jgi:glycosyltransferase involved in cell wall biosynthesis
MQQRLPVSELLVVDDGSTDHLRDCLGVLAERVSLIRHETNLGSAAARNTGIRNAQGEFVAFLDSDDTWKPDKLEKQLAFMHQHGLDFCCTGFEIIDPGATSARPAWRPYPETLNLDHFVWGCFVAPGSTFVARRTLLEGIGGYDARFPRFEDWDLMLRLAQANVKGIGFLNKPLATIHFSGKPDPDKVLLSLETLQRIYLEALSNRNTALARNLRSGLAFHRASAHAAAGSWAATASELARCFFLAPRGNWPLRVIIGGKIQGKLVS